MAGARKEQIQELRKRRQAARAQTVKLVTEAQALTRKVQQDCERLEQLRTKSQERRQSYRQSRP
jgi:hypothetical protein